MKPRTFKKIIIEDLEKRGLLYIARKIKSITYETFSMGNAARVSAENLFKTERETLDNILQSYAYGRFDAMTDCSSSERNPAMERQAKYVTLNNNFSECVVRTVKLKLNNNGIHDDATAQDRFNQYYETLVNQELCKIEDFDELINIAKSE